jgi:hypothetical protein
VSTKPSLLRSSPAAPMPGQPGRGVRLDDVCFKPFGDACATQSVLQYWQLNQTLYEKEQVSGPCCT